MINNCVFSIFLSFLFLLLLSLLFCFFLFIIIYFFLASLSLSLSLFPPLPFLPPAPRTIAKVAMLGSDFLFHITTDIPLSSIPQFLGGEFPIDYTVPFDLETASGMYIYPIHTPLYMFL